MIDQRIFWTIYALCVIAWVALLPLIEFGMGAGKPHHDWWRDVIDRAMQVIIGIMVTTACLQALLWIWR